VVLLQLHVNLATAASSAFIDICGDCPCAFLFGKVEGISAKRGGVLQLLVAHLLVLFLHFFLLLPKHVLELIEGHREHLLSLSPLVLLDLPLFLLPGLLDLLPCHAAGGGGSQLAPHHLAPHHHVLVLLVGPLMLIAPPQFVLALPLFLLPCLLALII